MQLTFNFVLQDATSANLMAQLEELNNLAGVVETQTANAVLQTRSNVNTLAPQTPVGFQSEEEDFQSNLSPRSEPTNSKL